MFLKHNLSLGILVSDCDIHMLETYRFMLDKSYPMTRIDGKRVRLHRLIMNTASIVDHINGITLDNRRENLRVATHAENMQNRKLHTNNTSGYKGVESSRGLWRATIYADNIRIHLGSFVTKEEAALAYNKAALKYHGEFARLNNL